MNKKEARRLAYKLLLDRIDDLIVKFEWQDEVDTLFQIDLPVDKKLVIHYLKSYRKRIASFTVCPDK